VCLLCGDESPDVSVALVRYRPEFSTGRAYDHVPRCRDHEACRRRCQAIGEAWPVAEGWDRDELVLA
jgi:hypothetical protein